MLEKFTLGRSERLKSRKQIEFLFASGKKFNHGFFRVYYHLESSLTKDVLVGTGVSSKIFKKATQRNRIKRLIKESYRLQKILLTTAAQEAGKSVHVFFIYTGKEMPVYTEMYLQMGKLLKRLTALMKDAE